MTEELETKTTMADEEQNSLTYIPEVILKKRKSNEQWAIRRKQQLEQSVRKIKGDSFVIKKPEHFIREYRDKELDFIQMKYRGKRKRRALVTPESKLIFIIRVQGYPNLKRVKDLIYKKGAAKFNKKIVPLTDNNIIEEYGIVCIEDIINEIANVGPHFKEVTSFLCPFTLNKPEKALQGKKRLYIDGGDTGNREDHVNELISKMN
ncbi:unnamed protein product [Ilex paraguariensis]|uniref:Large ribosomal subunit protein uL30 N-terminal eukaryotes domain-containing protein n=1 Tax=Ilex paraguariensis TaxID=185542 RepID=A0ABC8TAX8_9AQUA